VTIEVRPLCPSIWPRSSRSSGRRADTVVARCSPAARKAVVYAARSAPDHRLVGYVIVSRYVDAWHIMNVAVDTPHRRRGIARRLLEDLFESTAADGLRGYTLEVRVSNRQAIRLYEVLGFRISGVRRGYYTDNREDAYVMWKGPAAHENGEDDSP
jgi:ribosomal-protein-alanine N-acetyltransferase